MPTNVFNRLAEMHLTTMKDYEKHYGPDEQNKRYSPAYLNYLKAKVNYFTYQHLHWKYKEVHHSNINPAYVIKNSRKCANQKLQALTELQHYISIINTSENSSPTHSIFKIS